MISVRRALRLTPARNRFLRFLVLILVSTQAIGSTPALAQQPAEARPVAPPPAATTPVQAPAPAPDVLSWLSQQWQSALAIFAPPTAGSGAAPQAKGPAGPPPAVSVSRALAREIVEWDEYTGRLDAVDTVEVRARISGYLVESHFKDGQLVRKGDRLYSIDPRPFERALDQARAEVALAETRIANATKDVDRAQGLIRNRFITEKAFDDRKNVVEEAEAQKKVAEARAKAAELDLSFTTITAALDGRISRSTVSAGNYVIGGAANGTLLTTIVSQNPVQVYFDVNENNLIKYKRLRAEGKAIGATDTGVTVGIALPDETSFPHTGKLDFVDNRLDAGTGTLRVRALLDNAGGLFSPGMFARVRIAGSAPYTALLVPDEAIGTDQTDRFVYVVAEDGTANRRKITIGSISDGLRVVRAGLKPEDWVIVRGLQRARPGQKVTPKQEPIKLSSAPEVVSPR